jgi:tRNA G18 (ribose-2'-O)-methylase SpoU
VQPVADPFQVEADDPRLADYRHLTDAAARRAVEGSDGHGILIAEGVLALRQLLRSDYRIRSVLSTPARAAAVRAELEQAAAEANAGASGPGTGGAPHLVAPRDLLESVTGYDVHRGVLAAADRGRPRDPAEVLAGVRRVVVAEGLSDHENLGGVFRNAAALGLDAVLLDDRSADPLYRRSIRVSSGWALRLPFARAGSGAEVVGRLHEHGLRALALTPSPSAVPVDRAGELGLLDDPVAFVVGAEGPGLSPALLDACDARISVPMSAEVDSLNVATSLAVVAAFAAARRGWSS